MREAFDWSLEQRLVLWQLPRCGTMGAQAGMLDTLHRRLTDRGLHFTRCIADDAGGQICAIALPL